MASAAWYALRHPFEREVILLPMLCLVKPDTSLGVQNCPRRSKVLSFLLQLECMGYLIRISTAPHCFAVFDCDMLL